MSSLDGKGTFARDSPGGHVRAGLRGDRRTTATTGRTDGRNEGTGEAVHNSRNGNPPGKKGPGRGRGGELRSLGRKGERAIRPNWSRAEKGRFARG